MLELLPLLAIALIFWLLLVRPAARQRKQVAELQASLKVGDRVMLASGIFGTLTSTTDDRVRVEVAPGVELEVVRGAIGAVEAEDLLSSVDGPDADAAADADEGTEAPELPTHTDGKGRDA